MCSAKTPRAPVAAPMSAPMRDVSAQMDNSTSLAARQQAMRRGMASVWTRYSDGSGDASAVKADKLGG